MEIKNDGPDIFSFQLFSREEGRAFLKAAAALKRWRLTLYDDRPAALNYAVRRRHVPLKRLPTLEKFFKKSVVPVARSLAMSIWSLSVGPCVEAGVARYEKGDFLGTHWDFRIVQRGARLLSIVLYLNDDFTGGETVFLQQKVTVRPRAGRAILFPTSFTHPHSSGPIRKGTKYILYAWFDKA